MAIAHCKGNPCNRDGCSNHNGKSKWTLEKPDGGWGWIVVLGAALSNMTMQSVTSVFGLLFMRRLPELDIDTKGASLIVSVQMTIFNLSGLVTGPILKKYTCRQLAGTGAILTIFGLFLTGYANSLMTFVCTYSALTGLGLGLMYPSTFVAVNSYFTKWRARAVGLSSTGTGFGQMLLPLLVRYLLEEYNFKGTVLILSALSSHALVGVTLYQPVEWHMKRKKISEEEGEMLVTDIEKIDAADSADDVPPKMVATNEGFFSKIIRAMDWDLLKDSSFLCLITELGAVFTANVFFQMLLPFFLESTGYPRKDIAICMSIMSGADIVGRLTLPMVTDIFKLRTKTVFFVGVGLSALSRSGLVLYNEKMGLFSPTVVLAAVCGVFRAAIICNFNLSVSDHTTPEKLPSALGFHMVSRGLSVLFFGPIIGFIRDYTGSYSLTMHALSVFFLMFPFLMWLTEFISSKNTRK